MSYAVDALKSFLSVSRLGLRDLRSDDLRPFREGPSVPAGERTARLAAVQTLQAAAQAAPIAADAYAEQAGPPSLSFFLDFLAAAGLETTFTVDVRTADPATVVPALGFRTGFLQERAGALSVPEIRRRLRSRPVSSGRPVQHLQEPLPPVVADTDPYVRRKLTGAREYIGRYLSV